MSPTKESFNVFLHELKHSFQNKDLLLTASFFGSLNFFSEEFDFVPFNECFDLIHIAQLCFNEICWSKKDIKYVMNELTPSIIQDKVEKLIEWGLTQSKIVVGVQFGGPGFIEKKDIDDKDTQIETIRGQNYISKILTAGYSESIKHLKQMYDSETDLRILSVVGTDRTETIYYVTDQMIANTMRFAVRRNLAGGMGYLLEYDDFDGIDLSKICNDNKFDDFDKNVPVPKRNASNFPLLRTLNEAISLAIDEINRGWPETENNATGTGTSTSTNTNTNTGTGTGTGASNQPSGGAPVNNPPTQGGHAPGSASSLMGNLFCICFILSGILMSSILSP